MRQRLAALLFVAFVLPASEGSAQRTTGTVMGTVVDESGGALPGVSVTLQGAPIVGSRTSVTSSAGLYRFAALPPGDYRLTFSMDGFRTLNSSVAVALGATVEEDVSLSVGGRQEEVTVLGARPVVDTTGNQVSTTYDSDWVRNAPLRRSSFFDLINAAPGVTQSTAGGASSASSTSFGSGTDENSYQLDGTDFTAPLTGQAWPYPNTDAVEAVEVLSLGAPAEYGNLQGAVFNVVTRQGSNEFHGDANVYFQSQGLTGRNTTDEQDGGLPFHRARYRDVSLQLGGPIKKDKLWFLASYQYQRDHRSQPGVEPEFPVKEEADRVFFKLNYQINARHKLMFAYHDDYYRLPFQATAFTSPSSIQVESGHNPSPGVTYTAVLSDRTYVEARYSGFFGKDHADPLNGGPRVNPRFYDLDTGRISGGIYYWYDGDVWKNAASAKLSHFSDAFLGGTHDFKFGVQWNSGGSDYAIGPNDYIYTYSYGGAQVGYGYTVSPYHYGGEMSTLGVYADDSFRVNDRLTLNLGLRFDRSRASIPSFPVLDAQGSPTGAKSAAIDELYTWNSLSPRVGFNCKLTRDGRTVLKAHYGRYYRGVITGEFSAVGPSIPPRFLGRYDFDTGRLEDLVLVSDNTNLAVDPGYDNPSTDQFIASLERALTRNLGLSLHYVHKRGRGYGAWLDVGGEYVTETYVDDQGAAASGRPLTVQRLVGDPAERVFLLTNPPGMQSKVHAFTVQVVKPMSDGWQLVSSVVLSRATGRVPSSASDLEAAQRGSVRGNNFGRNPNDFVNTDGRLIGDRPVVFKAQFVAELPRGFVLGANLLHQRGRPWARTLRLDLGVPTEVLAERIDGSRRVPSWNVLDLRVQKEFGLGRGVEAALFVDVLNALNDDAHESVVSRLGTSDGFGQPALFLDPRRAMLGAKLRF